MEVKNNAMVYNSELETIGEFDRNIKRNSNDFTDYVKRGGGYQIKGMFDKAIDDYIHALSILNLEYGNVDIDKINMEIEKYNQKRKPENKITLSSISDLYNFIGLTFRGMNNTDKALFNYNIAITIDPKNYRAYNNIGFLYYDQKEYEPAIENYNMAIKYNEKYAEAFNNRGVAKSRTGDKKAAEEDYKEAIKHNNKFADPWFNLGILYFHNGKYKEAISVTKKAVKINNKWALAYFNLGVAYANVGNPFWSNYYVRKAYKLEPDNPLILSAIKGNEALL